MNSKMDAEHILELDDYEASNLRECLVYVRYIGGDTGDWHGQIMNKLNSLDIETKPNKTCQEQRRELALRIGWHQLDMGF